MTYFTATIAKPVERRNVYVEGGMNEKTDPGT